MGNPLRLVGASVQNLRGYGEAKITFPDLRILVGENNEGKSSLLKMVHRLVSGIPHEFWQGERRLSELDLEFWMPANRVAGKARRLTLNVEFCDGRLAKKFRCKKGDKLDLRFGITKVDGCARLNLGLPRKSEKHDSSAEELLEKLQKHLTLVLIPPVRDASSSRYTDSLLQEVRQKLRGKVLSSRRGGTPSEYRQLKGALENLQSIVAKGSEHFDVAGESVLARMVRQSQVRMNATISDLFAWMSEHMEVALSTGPHDDLMVSPTQVGNGLQSLIDLSLAIARTQQSGDGKDLLIFVEEPESFLHPSAQRDLMASIRAYCGHDGCRMVLTTHSPIVIDESEFPQVALVRKHRIYEPRQIDGTRSQINSHLMSTRHSEVFFADSVLLVEGPSDFAYMYALLRRLRQANLGNHALTKIHIQDVGSKTYFAPWIRLFEAYAGPMGRPIRYLCLTDGDALDDEEGDRSAIGQALLDCGFDYPKVMRDDETKFCGLSWESVEERAQEIDHLNSIHLRKVSFAALPLDLEWEIVSNANPETLAKLAGLIGVPEERDLVTIARRLGSKAGKGTASKGAVKAPHIFGKVGMFTDKASVPVRIADCFGVLLEGTDIARWSDLLL